jgi:hypothetical protein
MNTTKLKKGMVVQGTTGVRVVVTSHKGDAEGYPCFSGVVVDQGSKNGMWSIGEYSTTWNADSFEVLRGFDFERIFTAGMLGLQTLDGGVDGMVDKLPSAIEDPTINTHINKALELWEIMDKAFDGAHSKVHLRLALFAAFSDYRWHLLHTLEQPTQDIAATCSQSTDSDSDDRKRCDGV